MARTINRTKKTDTPVAESSNSPIDSVAVKLKANSAYSAQGIEITVVKHHSSDVEPGDVIDDLIVLAQDKLEAYSESYFTGEGAEKKEEFEEEEQEEEEFEEEEEEQEDDLTEDDINSMKKAELVALIDDEELDVDVKKFKKIADLRTAVIDALFAEEEEEEFEEEEEEKEDEDDITEEDINSMKKAELVSLIDEEELDVDVKKFKKIADLRAAVIDELFAEEEEEDEEEWDDDEWDDE